MYLGLDVGTSVIKAALFDDRGRQRYEASERLRLRAAPIGWSEIDGEDVWTAAARVIRALVAGGAVSAGQIRGVGITGVMVGAWLVDAAGGLLRPPILWNDARAQALVDSLRQERPDLISRVFAHSGSVMQLGCTLPVLAWLKENEPEVLGRARHVLCAKDFVRYRLTGEIATDESEAAMAPGSAVTRDFHPDQLRLLGVEDLAHLLPPVRRSEDLAGRITAAASDATGLAVGTPVAIGTGDASACVVGAGALTPGDAVTVLGTTCINGVVFDHAVYEPRDLGLLFIVPGRRWMKTMVNVAGTTVLDWALSTLCPDLSGGSDPYEALGEIAAGAAAGAEGVVFVPYLSASGVIAPRIEPRARAGFLGLAPQHGRSQLVRAVYEGMAYAIRDCYEAIGGTAGCIRLTGGGARSAFWSQMIADVTGYRVEIPEGTQFGAKGVALCAAVAVGDFASLAEAAEATYALSRAYDPATNPAYDEGFARFKTGSDAALGVLTGVA
ncbi:MAG: carbohydrate kinase [Ancalomicrobiaceae bacterium]|nr:carbohydrate kinase [Ancalomicrobiaceae bacterium]